MSANSVAYYSQQYTDAVELLSQQMRPKFAPTFDQESATGEGATVINLVGQVGARKRTTRNEPMGSSDIEQLRPWVYPDAYDVPPIMIETFDKVKMNADPSSKYVEAVVAALNRQEDDTAIAAFFADRNVSKQGVSSPSNEVFPVANVISEDIGGTDSGMNVEKLQAAIQAFEERELDLDMLQLYVGIPPKGRRDLMNEIEVTSGDFFKGEVMRTRSINGFLQLNFIVSNRLQKDANGFWRCPIYSPKGMSFCRWGSRRTDVSERKDLAGLPWQVYEMGSFGAVRRDNNHILEIKIAP